MPELVAIPISFFELSIDYDHVTFKLLLDRASVLQSIYDALKPWSIRVDDLEPITTGKITEQGINIKLPLQRVVFFFSAAGCKFTREGVDWPNAEETIAIADAALTALTESAGITLGPKNTSISIHLQPKTLPFIDLLKPLIPSQLAALDHSPPTTIASVVKWGDDHKVTIDGSGALANALFLRFERRFPSTATYQEIANRLQKDEQDLFQILGVEEDQG
jgi:hypothetical protein